MPRKESYRHTLPHFQQPGQGYFITWNLKDAVPKKALSRYTKELEVLKLKINSFSGGVADSVPRLKKDADRNPHHPIKTADRNPPHPENKCFTTLYFLRKALRKPLRKYLQKQGIAGYKNIRNLCIGNKK
jgi:hypothetical protein